MLFATVPMPPKATWIMVSLVDRGLERTAQSGRARERRIVTDQVVTEVVVGQDVAAQDLRAEIRIVLDPSDFLRRHVPMSSSSAS